jgi:hypothetical protein
VFPHPVLRLYALPRCKAQPSGTGFVDYPPQGGGLLGFWSDRVRQQWPGWAPSFRHVLPLVVGLPHRGILCVISPPLRRRWAGPVPGLLHLPGRGPPRGAVSSMVPCPGGPGRASGAGCHAPPFATAGTAGASPVLRHLSSCLPRPEDAGGPPPPRLVGGCVWPAGAFKPSASARALSTLSQPCRVRGPPCGLQDTRSTLRPSGSPGVASRLHHGRQTRYGWGARPDPTGTCTLPETPSLSWRENAGAQALPKAGATEARRL